MSYLSAAGGNYYATGTEFRDGKQFGRQVARQRKTLTEARRALDESGLRGYVQLWQNHRAQRVIVAERDEAGNWWAPDPFTGNLLPMAPLGVKA
ncbi:hypothetical protein ACJ5H2_13375 [Nocardioides sp. R1-1]|uniref:hypothetical protein n=1 Tax=Nocardioides sp. R1-1 TaxID=3383502 RepID=UPI0038D23F98